MTPARIIAFRQRREAAGLKRRELWCTDDDWLALRAYLLWLAQNRPIQPDKPV
jgi:hypothetical protein